MLKKIAIQLEKIKVGGVPSSEIHRFVMENERMSGILDIVRDAVLNKGNLTKFIELKDQLKFTHDDLLKLYVKELEGLRDSPKFVQHRKTVSTLLNRIMTGINSFRGAYQRDSNSIELQNREFGQMLAMLTTSPESIQASRSRTSITAMVQGTDKDLENRLDDLKNNLIQNYSSIDLLQGYLQAVANAKIPIPQGTDEEAIKKANAMERLKLSEISSFNDESLILKVRKDVDNIIRQMPGSNDNAERIKNMLIQYGDLKLFIKYADKLPGITKEDLMNLAKNHLKWLHERPVLYGDSKHLATRVLIPFMEALNNVTTLEDLKGKFETYIKEIYNRPKISLNALSFLGKSTDSGFQERMEFVRDEISKLYRERVAQPSPPSRDRKGPGY